MRISQNVLDKTKTLIFDLYKKADEYAEKYPVVASIVAISLTAFAAISAYHSIFLSLSFTLLAIPVYVCVILNNSDLLLVKTQKLVQKILEKYKKIKSIFSAKKAIINLQKLSGALSDYYQKNFFSRSFNFL